MDIEAERPDAAGRRDQVRKAVDADATVLFESDGRLVSSTGLPKDRETPELDGVNRELLEGTDPPSVSSPLQSNAERADAAWTA